MRLPKLILTDIDGVWTDGGMYYDKGENEWKKFNTSDSAGVLFCKLLDIKVGIMTGENTPIVQRRADKLKVDFLYLGAKNKLQLTTDLCKELGIELTDVAYIGDDINDMLLLREVGWSGTPTNAPQYVKECANIQVPVNGGDGAFRWFVEHILKEAGALNKALDIYLNQDKTFRQ